jgi:hypothetical protein
VNRLFIVLLASFCLLVSPCAVPLQMALHPSTASHIARSPYALDVDGKDHVHALKVSPGSSFSAGLWADSQPAHFNDDLLDLIRQIGGDDSVQNELHFEKTKNLDDGGIHSRRFEVVEALVKSLKDRKCQ